MIHTTQVDQSGALSRDRLDLSFRQRELGVVDFSMLDYPQSLDTLSQEELDRTGNDILVLVTRRTERHVTFPERLVGGDAAELGGDSAHRGHEEGVVVPGPAARSVAGGGHFHDLEDELVRKRVERTRRNSRHVGSFFYDFEMKHAVGLFVIP